MKLHTNFNRNTDYILDLHNLFSIIIQTYTLIFRYSLKITLLLKLGHARFNYRTKNNIFFLQFPLALARPKTVHLASKSIEH